MALGSKVSIRKVKGHPRYHWRATFIEAGKRVTRYFKTKAEAEEFQTEHEADAEDFGTGQPVSADERAAINEHRDALTGFGLTVRDALKLVIDQQSRIKRSADVATLCGELIAKRRQEGRSRRYLDTLRSRLGRFERDFGDRPVADVQAQEIDRWFSGLKVGPSSIASYRRILSVLFNEGKSRGYCTENTAGKTLSPKLVQHAVGILTPEQTARLVEVADEAILPAVVLGLFAGLRDAELRRVDWAEVDLVGGHVEVKATKAKSARRRLIPIKPNLAAWLEPLTRKSGLVWPSNGRKLMESARRGAGFNGEDGSSWPHNGARHSFASYHLAKFQDAAALALELGHTDTSIIFAHYRELVRPAAAETYWNISPARAHNVTRLVSGS